MGSGIFLKKRSDFGGVWSFPMIEGSDSSRADKYNVFMECYSSLTRRFNIPTDYLEWIVTNVDSRPDVVELVKRYLGVPRDIFSVCAQTVANVYAEASKMDVTSLSKENALRYQQTMDVTRRMQAILDSDAGKGSPQAQEALRALRAQLAVIGKR